MKYSIKDFFSKYDKIRRKLWTWSHLLKKFWMEKLILSQFILQLGKDIKFWKRFYVLSTSNLFNPIQMDLFRPTYWWGGPKRPPFLKSVTHILQSWNLAPYLKKTQKIYESRDIPLKFCWHQHFFIGSQQILLYQKIQI